MVGLTVGSEDGREAGEITLLVSVIYFLNKIKKQLHTWSRGRNTSGDSCRV